jgi:hypothetical protein
MIRPLERQFEPDTVERIRALQRSLQSLPFEGRPARYLASEIVRCLEAGLLLAALQVALSLLELFFRDLLISIRFHQVSDGSDTLVGPWRKLDQISEDIEDGSRLDFYSILDELVESAVVDQEDAGQDPYPSCYHATVDHTIRAEALWQRWLGCAGAATQSNAS